MVSESLLSRFGVFKVPSRGFRESVGVISRFGLRDCEDLGRKGLGCCREGRGFRLGYLWCRALSV